MQQFEAIHFDMDGVIADTEHLHVKAEQQTCVDHQFDIDPEQWGGFKGRTPVDIFNYLIETYGDSDVHDLDALMSYKTDLFIEFAAQELQEIDGSIEFLQWARENFDKMSLVTSSNRRTQEFIVEKFEIANLFDTVINGDDIKNGKPHPEPYQKAIQALGTSAHLSLVVEDSKSGIQSGHAAGCDVFAIATSHTEDELAQENPLHIFGDYKQAKVYLNNWYNWP